jgi:integrase
VSYLRKLPSGKWQATVRGPDGKKHTFTDPLKTTARKWAAEQEALLARGDFRDPHLGQIRAGDWYRRVSRARGVEAATRAKHATLWRTHCEPEWTAWPMAAVTRLEAQSWVDRLKSTRLARYHGRPVAPGEDAPALSAATITAAVHLMSGLYRLAMREHPPLVTVNPFADLELPTIEPQALDFYEHDEADALYKAAGAIAPKWRTFTELGTQVGLRLGELSGLHGHRVDWLRSRITVVDVMTRQGLREYPKSRKSHRMVPVPPDVLEGLSVLMAGRPREALVFTAPEGGPMGDVNFRNRVWNPAVEAAGIRVFPPRVMRHTAASWLVMDGVPLYDVQALLGHESFTTTQRYAHLAPDAHSRVIESWSRRRGAPVAHGRVSQDAR